MVLLTALGAGLVFGLAYSRWQGIPYRPPELRANWLVFLAFLPQLIVLYLPYRVSDQISALCLLASLPIFLGFTWVNRNVSGMKILLLGLALNFTVMAANGGFMPISPQTAGQLVPENVLLDFQPGDRFGTKDIYLTPEQTRLEWLADRFLTPAWISHRVAFSFGDIFIAIGAFSILAFSSLVEIKNRGIPT